MPQYLRDVLGSIKKRGLLKTTRVLASEVLFDVRHGTQTMRLATLEDLGDVASQNRSLGGDYQGVNAWLMSETFKLLFETTDIERGALGRMGFVDYGSGKGRALLLASLQGFGRVTGVEFSPTLCADARQNWERFRQRHPKSTAGTACEVICADATQVDVRVDDHVFFFFNPFSSPVLDHVVERVMASLRKHPRPHAVVYMHPRLAGVMEHAGLKPVATLGSPKVMPDAILYQAPPS